MQGTQITHLNASCAIPNTNGNSNSKNTLNMLTKAGKGLIACNAISRQLIPAVWRDILKVYMKGNNFIAFSVTLVPHTIRTWKITHRLFMKAYATNAMNVILNQPWKRVLKDTQKTSTKKLFIIAQNVIINSRRKALSKNIWKLYTRTPFFRPNNRLVFDSIFSKVQLCRNLETHRGSFDWFAIVVSVSCSCWGSN